jgi:hypothetical protein
MPFPAPRLYNENGDVTDIRDLGYAVAGIDNSNPLVTGIDNTNPGDVLAYNPVDIGNKFRAGEFALYDEYEPRREILIITETEAGYEDLLGTLYKEQEGVTEYEPFLLNFDETEGVVRPDAARRNRSQGHRPADR